LVSKGTVKNKEKNSGRLYSPLGKQVVQAELLSILLSFVPSRFYHSIVVKKDEDRRLHHVVGNADDRGGGELQRW